MANGIERRWTRCATAADTGRAPFYDCGAPHMTIDEYMAKAHAALDEAYANALKQGIASLSEHGEPTGARPRQRLKRS